MQKVYEYLMGISFLATIFYNDETDFELKLSLNLLLWFPQEFLRSLDRFCIGPVFIYWKKNFVNYLSSVDGPLFGIVLFIITEYFSINTTHGRFFVLTSTWFCIHFVGIEICLDLSLDMMRIVSGCPFNLVMQRSSIGGYCSLWNLKVLYEYIEPKWQNTGYSLTLAELCASSERWS